MTTGRQLLTIPYGAYHNPPIPAEAKDLTHVEKGSLGGEYLRRYWQPVAMTSEVGDLPVKVRMFGEDLILFRATGGDYGLLDLHCSHRGTSLEFGIPSPDGIRCCYHGWLFAVDGRILETPGDPPGSTLKDRICHGAYPVKEYRGLIFGYFGPPELKPEFPDYDSYHYPDDRLVPYFITYPCNWLQVHENVMDPAHGVFLHTRISFSQFADAWGELPIMEFVETAAGMIYVTTRRWQDKVWVRSNDIILPNLAQVGHIWEDGQDEKAFARVGITRWTTPVDNTTCKIIGWRHFHPEQDPRGLSREDQVGRETTDFFGQNGARPYEDRQRLPGDFDAQTSQRPIAIHALEHLTVCDKGVVMLRRLLNREMRKVARGEAPYVSPVRSAGQTPTYCHDTVVAIPPSQGGNDDELLTVVGRKITEIVTEGDHQTADDRTERIRALIREFAQSHVARAAE
jgi:nitrite reductase/ring-hydroxylating ferredoxin subunit